MATGRRKTAMARVRLIAGAGQIAVNGRALVDYFTEEATRKFIEQPFVLTGTSNQFDVTATLKGGGPIGQAGALRHGISRALAASDPARREPLKANGCLTRDARKKERKKPGQPGARKRFQFSKR
ncbi:MAG: 30S ribosomal protein S9 [Kiritimatiellia bacterium]|nr:30S ribosomal protein S9 [Kiritimatiellia bacterium]